MVNIFLFLAAMFALTFIIGRAIEKLKVPWIFGALIVGVALAVMNPFFIITSSPQFAFLADVGLYLLLFVIGFEIDIKKILKEGPFIIKSTLFIILFEAFFGSLLIHYIFGINWLISVIVALSFATVGEAILIPILEEFKIINTALGIAIIGVGTLDDGVEILTLILAVLLIGSKLHTHVNILIILGSLLLLFVLTFVFRLFNNQGKRFKFLSINILFFFVISILFLFLGVGSYAEATSLGALLAGISLKTFLPKKRYESIAGNVKAICYGFFAPIFFLDVGLNLDISYLIAYPLLIVLVVVVTNSAKIISGYIIGRKKFGMKKSILFGVGISVRFSTSIVIVKLLYDSGIIPSSLYSVIVVSTIIFTFLVPFVFSNLITRWKITKVKSSG